MRKEHFIIDDLQFEVSFNEKGEVLGMVCIENGINYNSEQAINYANASKKIYKSYNGFYKVETSGFSLTSATFFNPITKESFSKIVWDNDDDRVKEENEDLYYLPICERAKQLWLNHNGVIQTGDMVKIVKGRKMVGEVKKVVRFYEWEKVGSYGNIGTTYCVFDDDTKVNINNCELYRG